SDAAGGIVMRGPAAEVLWVSTRMSCARGPGVLWRRWRRQHRHVGGNTAVWSVVSEYTSTLASAGMTIDASVGNVRAATKSSARALNKEHHERRSRSAVVDGHAASERPDHCPGRQGTAMARSHNPCCLNHVRRLSADERIRRIIFGIYIAPIRSHTPHAVSHRRAAACLGDIVVPPLR